RRTRLRRRGRRSHGGRGEHARRAQRDRVHAVLLLPLAHAGPSAGLVQRSAVPGQGGARAQDAARRDGLRAARRRRDPGVGLLRRGSLPGPATAPAGNRGHGRGGAGRAGHPGFDDRRGPPVSERRALGEADPGPLAEYFDGWYADMTTSPVKDEIHQRHLGLPPHLLSTSLLGWAGIAEAVAALRLSATGTLVDLACGRGGYGLEIAGRTGPRPGVVDFS